MNYFLVSICFFGRKILRQLAAYKKKCMKNYTKIKDIVENFTVPLAFFRKGGILRLYSDADFSDFVVRMGMH